MTLEEDIYRYAVKNAFQHEGKADVGAVVGKIIALTPEVNVRKVMPEIQKIVQQVNGMGFEEIKAEYEKFAPGYELKAPEKKEGLPALDWAEEEGVQVVTRYAPNPNGPFHLGNARAAILSYEYARKYNGKFILRFEDTDPQVKKPMPDAEKVFQRDLHWLGIRAEEVYFQSDRLEIYYSHIKQLIELGKAYICTCEVEAWRKLTQEKKACGCRDLPPAEQMERFKKMLKHEFRHGEAVVRLKTDLEHPDLSVRDFWLARVVDNPNHPRQGSKHFVWPAYNLAAGIDDHLMGVTLILRGQEHTQNEVKQKFMYNYLGWTYPHTIHFGRVKLEGMVLSTSKIAKGIAESEYFGWDDPKLGTIAALRRRGFAPEALKQAILDIGIKTSDTTIAMPKLIDLNKQAIDQQSDRLMFISDPIKLEVRFCPKQEASFPIHPEFPEKGRRKFLLSEGKESFIVSREALSKVKEGTVFRLRNAYNVKLVEKNEFQAAADFVSKSDGGRKALFWLLKGEDLEIMMPDTKKIHGLVEEGIKSQKIGSHIQLEGFGYVRLDAREEKKFIAWFTHP